VELRDLSAALLGLAIIAHPPMWLVLVLFCVFGIAMYSGQCLEAIYPSELFPTGVRATANGFATGASRIGAAIGVYAPRTCSTTRCSRIQRGLPTVDGADGEVGGGR